MRIPFLDLKTPYLELKEDIDQAVLRALDSGWYILGNECAEFEKELQQWLVPDQAGYVVGVNSGTDALVLSLLAAGVRAGDEVITVANTAIPTVTAIQTIGAVPVFCEIHPQSWLLNPTRIHDLVTVRTRAIIPVHLFGNMVDMEPLLEVARHHQLPIIEDTAQAFGACYQGKQAGTIGDFGAFSFYPSKNLGALGDAGAVFCRSAEAAQLLRQLRNYGQSDRYHATIPQGRNTRLDEIQAAILRVKLQHVHRWNQQRNHWVGVYQDLLKQANLPLMTAKPTAQTEPAWHLMAVRLYHGAETRDQLQQYLKQCGIGTLIHYPHILSSQPAFAHYDQRPLPITEAHCNEVLSLPLHPYLSEAQIHEVCSAIQHFF